MSGEFAGKIKNYLACGAQELEEISHVFRKRVLVKPAQSYVQKITFTKTPAIAL